VVDAVIFDFDGLILDTETPAFTSTAAVFAEHGVELDRDRWLSIIGVADHPHWTEMLEGALGQPLADRERVIAERNVIKNAETEAKPIQPGIVALLDECAAAGVPVGVASSSHSPWVHGHLERLELFDRFGFIATRDLVDAGKPSPDLFVLAVEQLGVDPSRTVGLDDSPAGIASAKAAGLAAVGVPSGMTSTADFSGADLVVGSVENLDLTRLRALLD
jgi:HAD superfamily hydrolase (TIGR01509 family)